MSFETNYTEIVNENRSGFLSFFKKRTSILCGTPVSENVQLALNER